MPREGTVLKYARPLCSSGQVPSSGETLTKVRCPSILLELCLLRGGEINSLPSSSHHLPWGRGGGGGGDGKHWSRSQPGTQVS